MLCPDCGVELEWSDEEAYCPECLKIYDWDEKRMVD
jgi:Zn-finger nucleic acid-binding protein